MLPPNDGNDFRFALGCVCALAAVVIAIAWGWWTP
jgi:hypothetical protein